MTVLHMSAEKENKKEDEGLITETYGYMISRNFLDNKWLFWGSLPSGINKLKLFLASSLAVTSGTERLLVSACQ